MARNEITGSPEPDDPGPLFSREAAKARSDFNPLPKSADIAAAISGKRRQAIRTRARTACRIRSATR